VWVLVLGAVCGEGEERDLARTRLNLFHIWPLLAYVSRRFTGHVPPRSPTCMPKFARHHVRRWCGEAFIGTAANIADLRLGFEDLCERISRMSQTTSAKNARWSFKFDVIP